MLTALITSKTRVKLLMKFFLNPETKSYLRQLSSEFGESTNGIRVELNRLVRAKLLKSRHRGRVVEYQANSESSLFSEIRNLVEKYMGIDHIVEELVKKIGDVESAYLVGDYARGVDSGLVDIVLVGQIDKKELDRIAENASINIQRKIRWLVLTKNDLQNLWKQLKMDEALLIWDNAPEL